ncbi:MAG: branched-chain amino acid ABC transporter permease [Candidatus Omnitrophica bacterium]|nr:branched-chain amino acid ABC transporter permease [Candidatus Omnitrophota bacterium]
MNPTDVFLQQLINGVTIGAIYALIALGYTMVYGIIQLINFAHGEVFMLGAYLGLVAWLAAGVSAAPAAVPAALLMGGAAVVGCAAAGWLIERVAYRPLRQSPKLTALITAIGVSFVLQNVVMLSFGARDRHVPNPLPAISWAIGGVTITGMQALIWLTAVVMMLGVQRFVRGTRLGQAMLATAQDPLAARLMGIPVDRVVSATFMIGSALAGAGGLLFGLYYATINFHDGYLTGLKAFTAAVLGGIGNIPGAALGGLLLGLLEGLGAGYGSSQWKNALAFAALVLLLMFRPRGLLGERVADRA